MFSVGCRLLDCLLLGSRLTRTEPGESVCVCVFVIGLTSHARVYRAKESMRTLKRKLKSNLYMHIMCKWYMLMINLILLSLWDCQICYLLPLSLVWSFQCCDVSHWHHLSIKRCGFTVMSVHSLEALFRLSEVWWQTTCTHLHFLEDVQQLKGHSCFYTTWVIF